MIKKPKPKRSKTIEIVSPAFIENQTDLAPDYQKKAFKITIFENWGSFDHLRFSLLIFALLELNY